MRSFGETPGKREALLNKLVKISETPVKREETPEKGEELRFSYPYIPTGIYAEIWSLSNLRFQTQEEITRIRNRIARWISIYFPEYKDVYGKLDAVSGLMVLKEAPLPRRMKELGAEGINQIWRKAKLRGAGMKRGQRPCYRQRSTVLGARKHRKQHPWRSGICWKTMRSITAIWRS